MADVAKRRSPNSSRDNKVADVAQDIVLLQGTARTLMWLSSMKRWRWREGAVAELG